MLGVHLIPNAPIEDQAAALGLHRPALAGGFDGRRPPFDPPGAKVIPFPLDRRRREQRQVPVDRSGVQAEDGVERAPAEERRPERDQPDQA